MVAGYARVSTKDQSLDSQKNLLKKAGREEIYSHVASGMKEVREGLKRMLKYPREDDTVITYKNNRMSKVTKDKYHYAKHIYNNMGFSPR